MSGDYITFNGNLTFDSSTTSGTVITSVPGWSYYGGSTYGTVPYSGGTSGILIADPSLQPLPLEDSLLEGICDAIIKRAAAD